MDNRSDTREFLVSRRARITPEAAGLPAYGGNRRVPGLRREEVALLAGVSVDYYNRLERGNLTGVSEAVLESIARALQLDEAEHDHLLDLARAANESPVARRRPVAQKVRPSIQRTLDAIVGLPAFVRNDRFDHLASNALADALYVHMHEQPQPNAARFIFLDPRSRDFFVDWETAARDTVSFLRRAAGANPHDRALSDLIGELLTRSDVFGGLWQSHNVRYHRSGRKAFVHPVVGALELDYEGLELPGDPGLTLVTYSAEAGTPSAEKLALLASWAATPVAQEG